MNTFCRSIFLLAVLVSSNLNFAQDLMQMKFDVLDEAQGLSNNWVTDIAHDSSGFIWVATKRGLNRYDGHEFKKFMHQNANTNSPINDNGQNLYVDPKGTLWISYHESGVLSKYDPTCQCFSHFTLPKNFKPKKTDSEFGIIYVDGDNNLWYSGNGLGLNIFNPTTQKTEHFDLPNVAEKLSQTNLMENNTVNSVYASPTGDYWLATQNGLYLFHKKTKQFSYKKFTNSNPKVVAKASFNKIIPEKSIGLWVSSYEGGLNYFDFKTALFSNYLFSSEIYGYNNLINDMAVKNQDEIWIVSGDRGLGVFNRKTGISTFNNQLLNARERHITFLERIVVLPHNLIFLTDETAVLKYNPYANDFHFTYLPIAESQHGRLFSIRGIIEYPATNEIYFGTDLGNGLNVLNNKTNKLTAYPLAVNPAKDFKMRIRSMYLDKENVIWILSRDYLYSFSILNKKLTQLKSPFAGANAEINADFSHIVHNKVGSLLVLTEAGGLYPFNTQKQKLGDKIQVKSGGKSISRVDFVCFDKNDKLYLLGDGKLAYRESENAAFKFVNNGEIDSFLKMNIKGMAADAQGNIWLAIRRLGLLKIIPSKGKFTYQLFTKSNGLPDHHIYTFNADPEGGLWMGTLSGAVYLNPLTNKFTMYNQTVGLDKFTANMNFIRSNLGGFYITVPGKYCEVDLKKVSGKKPLPEIYLGAFRVFNKEKYQALAQLKRVTVEPGENFFSFDFGCIDFTDQGHHKFAYTLDGWDKDWIDAGSRRYAGYTNLNEGTYTFRVKVANSEGNWSEVLSMPVNIETHFYKKNWFVLLVLGLFALFIFSLYMIRVRIIRRSERLKTEYIRQLSESRMEALRAQMNPHFIFNSLNSINRYIVKNDAKTSSLYLTRFAKLMRMVLDNSKHKTIALSDEISALRLYIELEQFRFEKKFNYDVIVQENVEMDSLQIPPLIIQPFVENAIWHGLLPKEDIGHLKITVAQLDSCLLIEIQDNGIGREKSKLLQKGKIISRESHGIKLTEERIQTLDGNDKDKRTEIIDLYDQDGNPIGTKVKLTLPISYDKSNTD